jgi:hypothetical protein
MNICGLAKAVEKSRKRRVELQPFRSYSFKKKTTKDTNDNIEFVDDEGLLILHNMNDCFLFNL